MEIKIEINDAIKSVNICRKTGNVIVYLIVAASIIVFVLTGRGAVAVQLSMAALIISIMQYLWLGISLEAFVRRLERERQFEFDGYPSHISNGGWVIYAFKMIVAIMAAVELILSV